MRRRVGYVLIVAGATAMLQVPADAASARQYRSKDCTPYNGPFGFYGNIWCQPPNEASYMRNLGASWPMETPASLRQRRTNKSTDW